MVRYLRTPPFLPYVPFSPTNSYFTLISYSYLLFSSYCKFGMFLTMKLLQKWKQWVGSSSSIQENDHGKALGEMMKSDSFFVRDVTIVSPEGESTTVVSLSLNCNDLFYFACADAQEFSKKDIPAMYRLYRKYGVDGLEMWACRKEKALKTGEVLC